MKKIAFVKRGLFSRTNIHVKQALESYFPEFEIETIDIPDEFLRKKPHVVALNMFHLWRLYGGEFVRRQKTIRDSFYNTPVLFSQVKRFMADRLGPTAADYAFTFQTQSLFDASVPGIPHFVYTDHTNLANLYYPGASKSKLFADTWLHLEGTIYRNAARTFTMSQHIRRSVIEQYQGDPDRTSCVYAGSNAMSEAVTLDNGGYSNQHVLFVGKYWERKGGPELAEAFRMVLRKRPNARLLIVGCSPSLDLPNCEVVGPVSPEEVKRYFSRASVFCMPSKVEPFGIVFIEALLNRIPVVAPRIGALPDFVDEGVGGLLVEPGNPRELAEALDSLLCDPEKCRRLGEAGHQRIRERYTWDAVGKRMRDEISASIGLPRQGSEAA